MGITARGSSPSELRTLATKKSRSWRNQAITRTGNLAHCKFCWRTGQMEVRRSTPAQVRKYFAHQYGEICEQYFYVYLHLLSSLTVVKYGKCPRCAVADDDFRPDRWSKRNECCGALLPWHRQMRVGLQSPAPDGAEPRPRTCLNRKDTTCPLQKGSPAERTAQHLSCCALPFRS